MQNNNEAKFADMFIVRLFVFIMIVAALASVPRLTATAEVLAAPTCEMGTHQVAGQCTPDPVPAALDTEAQDAEAEGQDVLPLSWHAAPPALWNALLDQHPEWYDDDVPSLGTVWVPVGTYVNVESGLALASLDGWMGCQDFKTFDGECFEGGPVEMLDIEPVPATVIYGAGAGALCGTDAQCAALDADRELAGLPALDGPAYGTEDDTAQDTAQVLNVAHVTRIGDSGNRAQMCQAARHILKRLGSTRPIFEDWTWRGAPRVVGTQNDALLDAAERAGLHGNDWPFSVKATTWLHQYVKSCRN